MQLGTRLQLTWPTRRVQFVTRNYGVLAQKIEYATRPEPIPVLQERIIPRHLDPFALVAPELTHLRDRLIGLLGSAHPDLKEIAKCYFLDPSKQLRSATVLLIAKATNGLGGEWRQKQWSANLEAKSCLAEQLDRPLQHPDVLNECNPSMPDDTASFSNVFRLRRLGDADQLITPRSDLALERSAPPSVMTPTPLLPTQIRLAQVVEMVHVASLLHDNITSSCESEASSGENALNNKLAILGGDFLLGRASTALSQLGESEVVELIASVIANQVEGEILRMDGVQTPKLGLMEGPTSLGEAWDVYLTQIYLKTASLMAKSARGAVALGGSRAGEAWKDIAYAYGRNLGIAHQLVEDARAIEAGESGLRPGLATAPILFAWEEHRELGRCIARNLRGEGDLERAVEYVSRSRGIERTEGLARAYAAKARAVVSLLPESSSRLGLETVTEMDWGGYYL